MRDRIGQVEALNRYPVKSMAGEALECAVLGWHGIEGDRRLSFRRIGEPVGFPWLTAGRFPELLLFQPLRADGDGDLPSRVRTPDGRELELAGAELRAELSQQFGKDVELMRLDHGIFDDAVLSLIAVDTLTAIERALDQPVDVRRFRPNVVVRGDDPRPFADDRWVGSVVSFGESEAGPAVAITLRDQRCSMINIDPDSADSDPSFMRAVVRLNDNNAGVYATVVRCGTIAVGDSIYAQRL
jgi:uncharacterized protein YcbX